MESTTIAEVAAGLASLGATVEGLRRYVNARTRANEERIKLLEAAAIEQAKRIDQVDDDASKALAAQREVLGNKIAEVHVRLDANRETLATVREQVGLLKGKVTVMRSRTGEHDGIG